MNLQSATLLLLSLLLISSYEAVGSKRADITEPDNPYIACYQEANDQDRCADLVGRDLWVPIDDSDCEIILGVLKAAYERGMKLSYKLLYFNERCRDAGRANFDRSTVDNSKEIKTGNQAIVKRHFEISVPETWKELPPDQQAVSLKVSSYNLVADCNVVVTQSESFRGISSKQLAEYKIERGGQIPPQSKLIRHRVGRLGSKGAYELHASLEYEILGLVMPMYIVQYSALNGINHFVLTCRVPINEAKRYLTIFASIAQSFIFH